MTVLEAVKRGHTPAFMYKSAIKAAQAALTPPETVLWAHTGNVILDTLLGESQEGLKTGVTVITSHRILFSGYIMGNSFTRSISFLDITSVKPLPEGFLMSLHIYSLAGYLAIQGNLKTIKELLSALKSAVASSNQLNSAELASFLTPLAARPGVAADKINLEPYFQAYYPNHSDAAQALHRDTELDMAQCQTMVSTYFSANLARAPMPKQETFPKVKHMLSPKKAALEKRMKELDRQGIAYCPKCASTSITAGKRGFAFDKAITASFFLSTEASLIAGASGADKPQCICMKCGHTWRP